MTAALLAALSSMASRTPTPRGAPFRVRVDHGERLERQRWQARQAAARRARRLFGGGDEARRRGWAWPGDGVAPAPTRQMRRAAARAQRALEVAEFRRQLRGRR